MVKRIFCYNKEAAKKEHNYPPYKGLAILILIIIAWLIFSFIYTRYIGKENVSGTYYESISIMLVFVSLILIAYFVLTISRRIGLMMVAYAIDDNGDVYKIIQTHNGEKVIAGSYVAGEAYDRAFKKSSGGLIGGAFGFISNIFNANKISNLSSNPDVINNILQSPERLLNGEVYKILKVKKIENRFRRTEIVCDYYDYKKGKVVNDSYIVISKVYSYYDDLMDAINLKKEV